MHEIAKVFDCGTSTIFYALQSLGITLKKRPPPTLNKTQTKSKISKTD
ncbi:IS630 transposase-related protein [Moraxella oblonga]